MHGGLLRLPPRSARRVRHDMGCGAAPAAAAASRRWGGARANRHPAFRGGAQGHPRPDRRQWRLCRRVTLHAAGQEGRQPGCYDLLGGKRKKKKKKKEPSFSCFLVCTFPHTSCALRFLMYFFALFLIRSPQDLSNFVLFLD